MSTDRNPLSGAAFERRVLSRLAEEGVRVEPSLFAATFDLFRAANRLMQDFEANVHRPLGMTWAGFRVLFCAWVRKEVEPRELARLCAVSRATVSSTLNTLERGAMIRRRRRSPDRRVVTVEVTAKGRQRIRKAFEGQHARERQWLDGIDREGIDGLVAVLRHLLERAPPPRAPRTATPP